MVTRLGCFSLIVFVLAAIVDAHAGGPVETPLVIGGLVVVSVDEASVTASVEGSVAKVMFEEGQTVRSGEMIVQLDDRKPKIEKLLAAQALAIAETRRDQTEAIDAAAAEVAEQERLIAEQRVRSERAAALAENELKIRAAEKAEAVALNEYNRAEAAKQSFDDAVSDSEIEGLRLAHQRSRLETQEAIFQNRMAVLDVRLDQAISQTLGQKLESARVALRAASASQEIRRVEADMQRLNDELAAVAVADRQLGSNLDGIVVSVRASTGDWVRPGQIVARVIGLRRLRVGGFAESAEAQRLRDANEISIVVTDADGQAVRCRGGKKFVSPEIDAVTNEVRFWVEFDNTTVNLLPGSQARVEIDP